MTTSITSATFLSDTVLFLRDKLNTNITDPISTSRGSGRFICTSYPQKETKYPIVTITDTNTTQLSKLGMSSEGTILRLNLEIRIWARNIKERDELFCQIHDWLRTNQRGGADSTIDAYLYDFTVGSVLNIDEENVKSKILEINYLIICN